MSGVLKGSLSESSQGAPSPSDGQAQGMPLFLLLSVFVVATCGLIYELTAGTLASYLLGDSVTQFSTVIGVYLFSMGVGSWLSRFVGGNPAAVFVSVELLIALVGGGSSSLLFLLFAHVSSFRILLYSLVFLTGALVGVEIPLVMRMLQDRIEFKELVARVFAFDYVGALIASLLFPLVLVPHLGLMRSSYVFGLLNALVALAAIRLFRNELGDRLWVLRSAGGVVVAILVAGIFGADHLMRLSEESVFPSPVIYAKSTPYQRIVLTRDHEEMRLYLNNHLQFSSRDEYRYHEPLVHPLLSGLSEARELLILGGGDGMAVREALRYPNLKKITLVDLDAGMTELFRTHPVLTRLNAGALSDPRVEVVNADAFAWIRSSRKLFDAILIDFPDPSNFSLGKLYSTTFYQAVKARLAPGGALAVQSTSPLMARQSYWCIAETLEKVGFKTLPYHSYVPSFGEWGYLIATLEREFAAPRTFPSGLRFLKDASVFETLRHFPADMARVKAEPNVLNNQILVRYYENEWSELN
jgi:spermidine synthase